MNTDFRFKGHLIRLALFTSSLAYIPASAQSLFSETIVQLNNVGYGYNVAGTYTGDNTLLSSSASGSFSGYDGSNNLQTMTFSATSDAQSDYGNLHTYNTETVNNTYYNPINPGYVYNGQIANASGTPTNIETFSFAQYSDALQFDPIGNDFVLDGGYTASFVYHVDGSNSGANSAWEMGVFVGSSQDYHDSFAQGYFDEDIATKGFFVNGTTPTDVTFQLECQVGVNTYDVPDGTNYVGTSDFSNTATVLGVVLKNDQGAIVPSWEYTVSSATGVSYAKFNSVPALPGAAPFLAGIAALIRRRRTR